MVLKNEEIRFNFEQRLMGSCRLSWDKTVEGSDKKLDFSGITF